MKILFHLGHPAHFHLFRHVIRRLGEDGHVTVAVIKKKDVLEDLVAHEGIRCHNILEEGRRDGSLAAFLAMLKMDRRLLAFARKQRPDLLVGTSVAISHVGRLLKIPSINVNEDDADAVPFYVRLAYPWATDILAPVGCSTGRWEARTIHYPGYHELAYLHARRFGPDRERISGSIYRSKPFFLLRFSGLAAHHDTGKSGIDDALARRIIGILEPRGNVYITSERPLATEFEKYRIAIDPLDIHHALFFADLFIGDSQTMTAEAAVLGTPALRFNDFVGRLGYLEELEHTYGLTYGFRTSEPDKLLEKLQELLNTPNLKEEWRKRRERMLADKIDVTAFMVWFIENYPQSVKVMREDPKFQYRFR